MHACMCVRVRTYMNSCSACVCTSSGRLPSILMLLTLILRELSCICRGTLAGHGQLSKILDFIIQ